MILFYCYVKETLLIACERTKSIYSADPKRSAGGLNLPEIAKNKPRNAKSERSGVFAIKR